MAGKSKKQTQHAVERPLPEPRDKRSRVARTRGPDLDEPVNKAIVGITPGFEQPKARRTQVDLLGEHRMEIIADAKELGLAAATEFEICQHFGIARSTLWLWRQRDPVFDAALSLGKDIADGKVEASLYHKARGYSFPAEKIHINAEGQVTRVQYIEHVPPDTTAAIFWLKNRKRREWTDQYALDVTDNSPQLDVRRVAMAVLMLLREAAQQPAQPAIEHDDA